MESGRRGSKRQAAAAAAAAAARKMKEHRSDEEEEEEDIDDEEMEEDDENEEDDDMSVEGEDGIKKRRRSGRKVANTGRVEKRRQPIRRKANLSKSTYTFRLKLHSYVQMPLCMLYIYFCDFVCFVCTFKKELKSPFFHKVFFKNYVLSFPTHDFNYTVI